MPMVSVGSFGRLLGNAIMRLHCVKVDVRCEESLTPGQGQIPRHAGSAGEYGGGRSACVTGLAPVVICEPMADAMLEGCTEGAGAPSSPEKSRQ
jgi:hypothetical protein